MKTRGVGFNQEINGTKNRKRELGEGFLRGKKLARQKETYKGGVTIGKKWHQKQKNNKLEVGLVGLKICKKQQ